MWNNVYKFATWSSPSGSDGVGRAPLLYFSIDVRAFSTTAVQSYNFTNVSMLLPPIWIHPATCGDGVHGLRPIEAKSRPLPASKTYVAIKPTARGAFVFSGWNGFFDQTLSSVLVSAMTFNTRSAW